MKRLPLLLILACSILLHAGAVSQSHSNPSPNFIFIFADDITAGISSESKDEAAGI